MSAPSSEVDACRTCGTALSSSTAERLCPKCLLERVLDSNAFSNTNGTVISDVSVPSSPFTGIRLRYFGDYELIEEIARGGMGVVFKARQAKLNRIVALKLINSGALASEELVKRFKAEAEAAATLNHANIVPIHEIGEMQGQHYFSMGLVDGMNLDQWLGAKPMTPREAVELLILLSRAVHHAHQRGVLHRDIKPSNVLIDRERIPYLTDFGLAKIAQKESTLTYTNAILGTPSYMSPEQARGETKRVTTAADVYGLGAVLYTCLTGQPPFAGGTTFETIQKVLEDDPRPPSAWNLEVDRDLDTICLKCLSKDTQDRYSSAEAVAADLEHWLHSEPIEGRPASSVERVRKWVRRRPAVAGLATLSCLLMIGLAVGLSFYSFRLRAAAGTLRQNLYAAEMGVAYSHWERGNATLTREILERYRPAKPQEKHDLRGFEWFYLDKVCQPQELFTFPKNVGQTFPVAVSPDGRTVAAGEAFRAIRLVDIVTHREIGLIPAPEVGYNLQFDHAGKRLLSSSFSGDPLPVWDVESKTIVARLPHSFEILAASFSPDDTFILSSAVRIYNRTNRGELFLWSGSSYERLHSFTNHQTGAWEAVFSPDGQTFATGHEDGTIMLWDIATRLPLRTTKAHANIVSALAFSPDGKSLATGSMDESVSLWSVPDFAQTHVGHHERVDSVVFSRDGQWLVSSARDATLKLWKLAGGARTATLRGHLGRVWSCAFSMDGHLLISGSADGTIKLWDWNKLKEQPAASPTETTLGLNFSPDSTLNFAEDERETRVQSVPTGRILTTLSITNADFSPDGRLIVGLNHGSIEVFDQKTFKRLESVFSGPHLRGPVEFSPGGSLLVGQSSNILELLNPRQKWERQMRWEVPFSPNGAAFSDDGKYLAAVGPEQRLAVFSMDASRPVREFRPDTADGMARLWKPVWIAGTHILASISGGIVVYLWSVDDNTVRRLKPGVGNTWALAASPDGRTLAIGTQDGYIKLINIATSREMATLRGHLTNIQRMSFSPDGTMLISTGGEGSRLWSAPDFPHSLGSIR